MLDCTSGFVDDVVFAIIGSALWHTGMTSLDSAANRLTMDSTEPLLLQ